MSALARFCKAKGLDVSGYDRTRSELTAALEVEGIRVHYECRPEELPQGVEETLVVYTPAVSEDFPELVQARAKGYRVIKRSKMLGEVTRGETCLAVAGTHGKTTTSTLIAHMLTESGIGCSAFLGGISKNYRTNMLVSGTPLVVAEADEFDRSFLQLHPQIAAITAMDADHLDIYGDLEHVQQAYREFAGQVSDCLVAKYGLPLDPADFKARIYTYSTTDSRADFHAENLRLSSDGHYTFDLVHPDGVLRNIHVGTLGILNVENSIAAAAVALLHGTSEEAVREAIGTFKGVKRRMEEHVNKPGLTYIDDYAHHPAELAASIRTIKEIFPGRNVCAVFQPHLFTRTRDFAKEFAEALSLADEAVLLDIYPARELPIEGITSEIIYKDVTCSEKWLLHYEDLLDWVKTHETDVLVTFGAGNIDRLVKPIKEILERK